MSRRTRRAAVALGTLVVMLTVTEFVLRAWWPLGGNNYRQDAELIHVPQPNSARLQLMPSYADTRRVLVEIGPDGYRGPALERPKTRPRLAILGDSLVLAGNTAESETFTRRLAEDLGDAFELVNVGAESYGPDQTLLRLEREFGHLDPDGLILVLCAHNDLGDPIRNKLFRLDRAGALARTAPEIGPVLRAGFANRERRAQRLALVRWLDHLRAGETNVVNWDGPWIELYFQAARQQFADWRSGNAAVDDVERDTYDADVALEPDSESAQVKQRLLAALLERLRQRAERAGIPLAIVVVPSPIDIASAFPIQVDRTRHTNYDASALVAACMAAADTIPALDLTPVFLAHNPDEMFVGGDDIHWNARAQELCAEACAAWLREHSLLPVSAD
jgi:lysophospholipase L1-like esterase